MPVFFISGLKPPIPGFYTLSNHDILEFHYGDLDDGYAHQTLSDP